MLLKQLLVILIVGVSVCRATIEDASGIEDAEENNTDWEDNDDNDWEENDCDGEDCDNDCDGGDCDGDDDDIDVDIPNFDNVFPDDDVMDNEEWFQDGYWEVPDSGRMCREGQELGADGTCVDCMSGYYNQDWLRVDVCMPCETGYYTNRTGSKECNRCPGEMTTDYTGAYNISHCQEKSVRLDKAYLTTVYAEVSVTGDLCSGGIAELLWGISNLQFYEASFTKCSYNESVDVSSMALKITPPTRYGMEVYGIFSIVAGHREMLNAYIPLGHYFAEKAFDMVTNSAYLEWFGLDMDIDQLNIDDFEIVSFSADFDDTCSPGYVFSEYSNMCEEEAAHEAAQEATPSYYIYYTMDSDLCADNAGQTMARNFIENGDPLNCGGCTTHFMFCEADGGTYISIT